MKSADRQTLLLKLAEVIDGKTGEAAKLTSDKKKKGWWQIIASLPASLGLTDTFDAIRAAQEYQDDARFIRYLTDRPSYPFHLDGSASGLLQLAREAMIRRRGDMIAKCVDHVHKKRMDKVKQAAAVEKHQLEADENVKCAKEYGDWVNILLGASHVKDANR